MWPTNRSNIYPKREPSSIHKEEAKERVCADQADKEGLQRKLEMCIDPLDPEQHPETIINVAKGMIGPPSVNIDKAIDIGTQQIKEFERKLLDGFYEMQWQQQISHSKWEMYNT